MTERLGRASCIATLVLLGAAACRSDPPAMPGLPGSQTGPETARLLATLTAAGFTFSAARYEPVPARNLHAPVTVVSAGDESLAIWEYPNPEAAADDGRRISPRGVDGGFLELGTEARWFLRGRLLVLYLGTDPTLRARLLLAFGQPFVGPAA